jgi:dipeptidase
MVALPQATANGQVIFGKNSDRPANEAQPLELHARTSHSGGHAGAQFVKVPQAAVTYRHVGSRPYWCAGYEHGFNEHQVVIGNEALPTRLKESPTPKLIGMELLRLGLERGKTAAEAVDVITGLVSQFGQGKFANKADVRTYDNSFIIADPHEAYIVEAAGHDWAVKQVRHSASISNVCKIGGDADRVSPDAAQRATGAELFEMGFGDSFVFADAFADRAASTSGIARQCRSEALLGAHDGRVDARTVMRVLSDHSDGSNPSEPFVEDVRGSVSICLHRDDPVNPGSSAASLVADLCADGSRLPVYWCGMYSPCMTLYMPVFIEGALPPRLAIGGKEPSDDSPWWAFYRLAQSGLREGKGRREQIRDAWRPLQLELMESAYEMAVIGRELVAEGRTADARKLLTGYMSQNFTRMTAIARALSERVATA